MIYMDGKETGRLAIPIRPIAGCYQADPSTDVVGYLRRRLDTLDAQFVEDVAIETLRELEEVRVLLGKRPS